MTVQGGILKRAILTALIYIGIMAVGMYVTGHIAGITYGDPKMVRVLFYFEVVMSLLALFMARRIFGRVQCGFSPADLSGLWWMAPNFLILAALFYMALSAGGAAMSGLVLLIIATMCLVGFSEELMFRGIVLKGALAEMSQGRAIILSSVFFSLLHSVNILAGLPVENMLAQLVLTFVFGLAMACYALRINSLIPVIVFHTLWDLVQFLGGIFGADFGSLINIAIIVNAVMGAALYILVLRKKQTGETSVAV
jgi:membrane protease YdiL (CAAX protease family)